MRTETITYPMVSLLCPTYGRAGDEMRLLEEKIYWFTKMNWPESRKELLILNDAPNQKLRCNVPGVRIINTSFRFATLGDKYNAMLALAKGEVIFPDEDDDISLPNRVGQGVKALWDTGYQYYNPNARWFQNGMNAAIVPDNKNYKHHACCYLRGTMYYHPITGPQDVRAEEFAHRTLACKIDEGRKVSELSYIYRWGVSKLHLSAQSDTQRAWNELKYQEGVFEIKPVMYRDYEKEVAVYRSMNPDNYS